MDILNGTVMIIAIWEIVCEWMYAHGCVQPWMLTIDHYWDTGLDICVGLFTGVHAISEVHLAWHEVVSWWFSGLCCLFSGLSSVLWTHCLLWRNWNSEGTLSSRVWLFLDLSLSLSRSFFLSLPPPIIKQFHLPNYIYFILSLNSINLLLLVPVGAKRKKLPVPGESELTGNHLTGSTQWSEVSGAHMTGVVSFALPSTPPWLGDWTGGEDSWAVLLQTVCMLQTLLGRGTAMIVEQPSWASTENTLDSHSW